jgi:hypothetical protein
MNKRSAHHIQARPRDFKADYERFCKVINSYRSTRLSKSNWAIHTKEPPKTVWQKLKRYIDPDDYLVILPLDAKSWTSQDSKALKWLLWRP